MIIYYQIRKVLTGLVLLVTLISCSEPDETLTLRFQLAQNGQAFDCGRAVNINDEYWSIEQFQFFIHDLEAELKDGTWLPLQLIPGTHSQESLALIGGYCNKPQDWQVEFKTDIGAEQFKSIRFTLGVPFYQNHQNPLTQASPLNQSDMFWVWQTGHKFLRWEMQSKENSFVYHLGSTGCNSPAAVRGPQVECKNPNRSLISFENYDFKRPINIDIAQFLNGLPLSSDIICKSSPDNPDCNELMARSGIHGVQQLFRVD